MSGSLRRLENNKRTRKGDFAACSYPTYVPSRTYLPCPTNWSLPFGSPLCEAFAFLHIEFFVSVLEFVVEIDL